MFVVVIIISVRQIQGELILLQPCKCFRTFFKNYYHLSPSCDNLIKNGTIEVGVFFYSRH